MCSICLRAAGGGSGGVSRRRAESPWKCNSEVISGDRGPDLAVGLRLSHDTPFAVQDFRIAL